MAVESDFVTAWYVWETTRGTTPTNPVLKPLRVTSPEVTMEPEHTESAELNAHRQSTDFAMVGLNVGGTMGLEISYGNADEWFEAAMCGTWSRKANGAIASCTTTAFTVANATSFKKGMVVRVAGMLNAANNGLFVLTADGSGGTVSVAGLTAEASAPGGATMTCVGFQCASAEGAVSSVGGRMVITITTTSGDFTALGLSVGEWIKIGGSLAANQYAIQANNNGWGRISAITATTLTFDIAPAGFGTDAATGKTIRLTFGDRLTPGTTRRFATVQRRLPDPSGTTYYENSRGQEAAQLAMEFRPRDIIKSTLTLMGDDGAYAAAQIAGATEAAATATYDVMNTGADLGRCGIDGTAHGSTNDDFVQSLSFTLDNRMRNRAALGRRGWVGRGLGKLGLEGQADLYFGNLALLNKALANTDVQVDVRFGDAGGRTYLVDLPALKFAASPRVGGTGQDVMLSGRFKARRHPTLGYPILMQRYPELL